MNTYYSNSNNSQIDQCNNKPNYYCEEVSECNKYKQKSDELYIKATCIQDEAKRLSYEAKELDEYAKELEYQARQICSQAKEIWSTAAKLEADADSTLDLANFYCDKAISCYKNLNNTTSLKPSCSNSYNCHNPKECI